MVSPKDTVILLYQSMVRIKYCNGVVWALTSVITRLMVFTWDHVIPFYQSVVGS